MAALMAGKKWSGLNVFRCDWCGRFYSSPLPEGSACPNHIREHNERLRADIARFNARLRAPEVPSHGR
jgi:hypothetical protein